MGSRRRARSDGLSQGVSRRWVPAGVEVGGPEARAGSGERRQVAASAVAEMAWRRECANLRALLWHTSIALANNSSADTHGEEFAPARIASGLCEFGRRSLSLFSFLFSPSLPFLQLFMSSLFSVISLFSLRIALDQIIKS